METRGLLVAAGQRLGAHRHPLRRVLYRVAASIDHVHHRLQREGLPAQPAARLLMDAQRCGLASLDHEVVRLDRLQADGGSTRRIEDEPQPPGSPGPEVDKLEAPQRGGRESHGLATRRERRRGGLRGAH